MNVLDRVIGFVSPTWGLRRAIARRALKRGYSGAEANRTTGPVPKLKHPDAEALGPAGADAVRAWAKKLVRDNAIATGIVETIATSVVGRGINAESSLEDVLGNDEEAINDARDAEWNNWCEDCDWTGRLSFSEIQFLAMREIVTSGECFIRFVTVKDARVPLAIEIISADRIAVEKDTYYARQDDENKIVRGIEMTPSGKPVAYWVYPEHPNSPLFSKAVKPVSVSASDMIHLYIMDESGQSRGVSWFHSVLSQMRDLAVYWENELQASAIAACFTAAIKTNGSAPGLAGPDGEDTVDANGNVFEYLEPGLVVRLNRDEDVVPINPGRPNSAAEPWINLIQRLIGVGVGLGYEKVSRDFSRTSYSSARTAELEDRKRFRIYQDYIIRHLCQRVWDRFCVACAMSTHPEVRAVFPKLTDLDSKRRALAPVAWQVPEWEWVDPQNDQAASEAAIKANMSNLQRECGKNGIHWKKNLRQRAKEKAFEKTLGVQPNDDLQTEADVAAATGGTGELKGMGRRDFTNTNKAMMDILNQMKVGGLSETQARVQLSGLGYSAENIDALIADMADGILDEVPA